MEAALSDQIILKRVFSFLDAHNLCRICSVSTEWQKEAESDDIWIRLSFQRNWKVRGNPTWKLEYKQRHLREKTQHLKRTVADFEFGKQLGVGAYGLVFLATEIKTGTQFAIKRLDKQRITKEKKVPWVNRERNTLDTIRSCTGVVRLEYTFQDPGYLYFVLNYCPNGDLESWIQKYKTFSLEVVKFRAAEMISILQSIHSKNIVHRDFKPENLLLDGANHLVLTDFGTAKNFKQESNSKSFVGTAAFVCPELLQDEPAGPAADIWAVGVSVFYMLCGQLPFFAPTELKIFELITNRISLFLPIFPMWQKIWSTKFWCWIQKRDWETEKEKDMMS
eukprot:TRINITY_DN4960_c0_g2_i1.p1 TRINITY_DN4960_c0_g2~~TRINITY_DN4960_c0_g2_i1.p1  ORF type:complete len:335 (-),score=79.29 TRINITY_DN4960_c0_g2_i1:1096-2100(-)